MKQFILGIESSCDETSVAVYDYANNKLLANIVSSQISTHTKYGGVMPEIASRLHIEKINYVIKEALYEAICFSRRSSFNSVSISFARVCLSSSFCSSTERRLFRSFLTEASSDATLS